ncbi:MAG: YtxH domain-containing protein [Dissulfurimicrobium sp.]|uniref:YtxH domain-containing protein n=1 Tax=Dissulfurimicrobium TaxID=1769732 RepID=UPI001EDC608B|nr:YtxH domain-containing protein [Dissulfurimicrobium hydrothermale]UKL14155.1 YtxH domain-containing protein [Dissulfurimicrobium hydrothermale]
MSCDEKFSAGSVVAAFLLGGAVGAGLAILFTPKSGPETRERLLERANYLRERAGEAADEVKEKAAGLLEKGKEFIEEKKTILESAIDAGKEAMEREKERFVSRFKKEGEEV